MRRTQSNSADKFPWKRTGRKFGIRQDPEAVRMLASKVPVILSEVSRALCDGRSRRTPRLSANLRTPDHFNIDYPPSTHPITRPGGRAHLRNAGFVLPAEGHAFRRATNLPTPSPLLSGLPHSPTVREVDEGPASQAGSITASSLSSVIEVSDKGVSQYLSTPIALPPASVAHSCDRHVLGTEPMRRRSASNPLL